MPALSNRASIRLWSQKASPLALLVFHIAPAQRGKSRLFQATELLFETADDFVEQLAKDYAQSLRQQTEQRGGPSDVAAPDAAASVPVQVKGISVQSCTPTELFFRCSAGFPQVQAGCFLLGTSGLQTTNMFDII